MGISVAKLQEAIEDSVSLTGRRFKVLDRMGMADMAMASLNDMLASQTRSLVRDAAVDNLAGLGLSAIESTAAITTLAIQDQTLANHALASGSQGMTAAPGIDDQANAHIALGPGRATGNALDGLGHASIVSTGLGSDLSSISGSTDVGAGLGTATSGLAGACPRPLHDIGVSAAASVWKSLDVAAEASRLADKVFGADATPVSLAKDHQYASQEFAAFPRDELGTGDASISDSIASGLFRGASAIIAAQDQFASFLTSIPPGEATLEYSAIAEQTSLFASTVDDMIALQRIDFSSIDMPTARPAAPSALPAHLMAVTDSFSDLFQDQVGRALLSDIEPPDLVAEHMILSTLPVAHFAEAVRSWAQPAGSFQRVARERPAREVRNDKVLDAMLAALNPAFVEMRHGAWHALETKGPDYVRHAGVSYRELVRLVLHHFVPASELEPEHRTGPGIKRRLKILFGGDEKQAHYAWALTEATFGAFDECNDHSHCLPIDEPSLRYFLLSAEGLLGFIIINAARAKR